jgi:hypothetical protein
MSKQLVELVLPRLAKNLFRHLHRYRSGKLAESNFSRCFQSVLQNEHDWLLAQRVHEIRAALAVHGAILVLSMPGLRAEAAESGLPLEVVERRAIRDAADDVASNYGISLSKAANVIGRIVARYGN